jgi:hypothetical protein
MEQYKNKFQHLELVTLKGKCKPFQDTFKYGDQTLMRKTYLLNLLYYKRNLASFYDVISILLQKTCIVIVNILALGSFNLAISHCRMQMLSDSAPILKLKVT